MRDRGRRSRHDRHTRPENKPYDFVPLADHIERSNVTGHEVLPPDCWYGRIGLRLTADSPVHVASGQIVRREDLEPYIGRDLDGPIEEELVLSHLRCGDVRVIPGTSLKGTVRAVVEAISYSCLTFINYRNVSSMAKDERHGDQRLQALHNRCTPESGVCPACALFGTLGYEGRVSFSDFVQKTGGG